MPQAYLKFLETNKTLNDCLQSIQNMFYFIAKFGTGITKDIGISICYDFVH